MSESADMSPGPDLAPVKREPKALGSPWHLPLSRRALTVGGVLAGLNLIGPWCRAEADPEPVTLTLDWLVNGTHAGYFVALERGFYREQDVAVTIQRGQGSGDTIRRVAAGHALFGVADLGSLVALRANDGVPVKAVAAVFGRAALGLLYVEGIGIRTPKDLTGRTVARSATGASVVLLPGFLKANGVDRQTLHEVVVDGASMLPLLLTRKVDAVLEQSIHLPRYRKAAEQQGTHIEAMRYADYGLVTYGNAIIVADATLQERPQLVTRFVAATVRGLADAFERPREAVEILQKHNREVSPDFSLDELISTRELAWSDEARAQGLGFMSATKMTSTRDVVTDALGLKRVVPIDELYTTRFLPVR